MALPLFFCLFYHASLVGCLVAQSSNASLTGIATVRKIKYPNAFKPY